MPIDPDRPRVLALEPNSADRDLIESALGRHCDLVMQPDPLHIFETLEYFEPDLLIMDLDLPQLTGFELISLIRHRPESREQRILIFSHQSETETQKLAYRLGVLHFQAKPCKPLQLFKGAAAFFRLAGGRLPQKKYPVEHALELIAEAQGPGELHPLLQDAVGHSARQNIVIAPEARRLVATVTRTL